MPGIMSSCCRFRFACTAMRCSVCEHRWRLSCREYGRQLRTLIMSDSHPAAVHADDLPVGDSPGQVTWMEWLQQPISNSFLPLFRISLGICFAWQIWWYFSSDLIRYQYIDPTFHFTWHFFEWVKPWPGDGMYVHFFVLLVAAIGITVGFYYRTAAVVFFVGYLHVFLIDECLYLNHYYLIVLLSFIAAVLPAQRRLSLDVWRHPEIETNVAPRWTLALIRFQVGIPYLFGGIAKLNGDWLAGEPLRTWLADSVDFPWVGHWFTSEWCVYLFVYGGLLIDLLALPALIYRRTRVPALILLTVFHLINSKLFQIGVFPWMMIGLTWIAFVDPDQWEKYLPAVARTGPIKRLAWPISMILILLVAGQLLVPWRHWLYPGRAAFTREGHHFSWRMKLNIRSIDLKMYWEDADGQLHPIALEDYLTSKQALKTRDADMVVQLAHHIAHSLDPNKSIPIRADMMIALNGRPPSPLIDTSVNLTEKSRTLRHVDWIHVSPAESSSESTPGADEGGSASATAESPEDSP